MEDKKINILVDEGKEFFAHEMSIDFNPTQFIFDFRCITPRSDIRTKETQSPFVKITHNIVMIDPHHAKDIHRVLGNVLEQYEKQFGKIEKPNAIKAFEKKHKKEMEQAKKEISKAPSYLG